MAQPDAASERWARLRRRLGVLTGRLVAIRASSTASEAPRAPAPVPASLTAESVLAPHTALVRRIRVAYGYPEAEFQPHLRAPITALAAWLHTLPGVPDGGFERRGGAIEQALTNCLFSLQAADGRTFDACHAETASPHDIQRWRLACALGGLFASLPETLERIEVVSASGRVWPGIATPLLDWLAALDTPKYRFRWTAPRKERSGAAVYVASRCIAQDVMALLAGNDRIAADLMACLIGSGRAQGAISEVVHRIAATVAARVPLETSAPAPDLVASTLQRLLGTSDWLPNAPGGHVWCGTDGLYLLWPDAAVKLREALPQGMRTAEAFASNDKLLQHLAASGMVHRAPSPVVRIRPPGSATARTAVRIAEPHRVLGNAGRQAVSLDLQVSPAVEQELVNENDAALQDGDTDQLQGRIAAGLEPSCPAAGMQERLDFAVPLPEDEAAPPLSEPPARLLLDTSKISNPRVREVVDSVVARLDQAFDSMLARIVKAGVFVALTEFVGEHGDGASVVRALHEAQLLATDGATADRRVVSERMEGADLRGVVLRASAFIGYADWSRRWQTQEGGDCRPLEPNR